MDAETTKREIIDLVKAYCRSKDEREILAELYGTRILSSMDSLFCRLVEILEGMNQYDCVDLLKEEALSSIQSVALLAGFLRKSKKPSQWIFFNIVQNLEVLHKSGIREARLPLAVHASLLIEELPENTHAQCIAHGALLATLGEIAPRAAIRHGLSAAKLGDARTFLSDRTALKNLQVKFPVGTIDLTTAAELSNFVDIPLQQTSNLVHSSQVAGIQKVISDNETEVTYPVPEGDSFYYLFKVAGKKINKVRSEINIIPDATVSLDLRKAGMPAFYIANGQNFVTDLSYGMSPFIQEPRYESEVPVFVLEDCFSGKPNISHFLFDHIPRLLSYREVYRGSAAIILGQNLPYFHDALRAVGEENIIAPNERIFSIRSPRVFLTSTMFRDFSHPADRGSAKTVMSLRRAFGAPTHAGKGRRLFISRADASSRQIINWSEVQEFLDTEGFETVMLANKSFLEQRDMFREASHVIGVHGAGLANIVFAPETCRLLEILPPLVASPAYWIMATASGQRYQAFVASDPEIGPLDYNNWRHESRYNTRNVSIDMEKFRKSVASFI